MLEYSLVLIEYYRTCRLSHFLTNITISLICSTLIFYLSSNPGFEETAGRLLANIITLLGVLIGFSISMFTLLNTASNPNIDEIKKIETGEYLYKKPVYLFDLLVMGITYLMIVESFLLLANLILPFYCVLGSLKGRAIFSMNIFLLIHIILSNISIMVNFYFIITSKRK